MDSWQNVKQMDIPEEAIKQTLENESSLTERLEAFVTRSPFVIAGILGMTAVCGIGAYKWKTRTVTPTVFLTQLRVAAQGTALAFITLGMIYNMYTDFIVKKKKE